MTETKDSHIQVGYMEHINCDNWTFRGPPGHQQQIEKASYEHCITSGNKEVPPLAPSERRTIYILLVWKGP